MKEKIIIVLKIILGFIVLVAIVIFVNGAERSILFSLFIFCIFVFYIDYEKIREKNKKIKKLGEDWNFCKELLDKERSKNIK